MKEKSYIIIRLYLIIVFLVLCFIGTTVWQCSRPTDVERVDTVSVVKEVKADTLYITRYDTMPIEREKVITKYVKIPVPVTSDSVASDTIDVTMPVVQKRFSDDSTYTAYVSGVEYQDLPKLDSISIRERLVYKTIRETYTIQLPQKPMRRWNVGVQAGYGYGFIYKGFEPYIGAGVTYRIW